jgi:hypothetical protein
MTSASLASLSARMSAVLVIWSAAGSVSGCDHGNDDMRSRVRRNIVILEKYVSSTTSTLNGSLFEAGRILRLPSEIGTLGTGTSFVPVAPRPGLEESLAAPDRLLHERYDIKVDTVGFALNTIGECFPGAGCLGATFWQPRWTLIQVTAPSGPHGSIECGRVRLEWDGIGEARNSSRPMLIPSNSHPMPITREEPCLARDVRQLPNPALNPTGLGPAG